MTKTTSGSYRFRRQDSIGAMDAENDERFLEQCFEDTGDLESLVSLELPHRIVLGRTGSGKSALLLQLKKRRAQVIEIEPESLSINYIANSTIIRFLSELGLNLDPFYKLLWRHVLAISLLQKRYGFTDEASTRAGLLSYWFESTETRQNRQAEQERRKKALAYLERWGGSFWKDVDVRTKEITTNFETEVQSRVQSSGSINAGLDLMPLKAGISGQIDTADNLLKKMSKQQQDEFLHLAQQVVNEIQVKELSGMLTFLDEVLAGASSPFYITIDRLDEAWVDDKLHYKLIKALVDTVREFGKVHRVKVIIALRIDLIERVFRDTKGEPGFQEEKYHSLYLPLRWSRQQLISLLNRRIALLIKDAYTKHSPTCDDILPNALNDRGPSVDYIIDRTWMRPRDVIDFFNSCIKHAEGHAKFSKAIVKEAEGEYSRSRLVSVLEEWHGIYPNLSKVIDEFLKRRRAVFGLGEIDDVTVDNSCLNIVCSNPKNDAISSTADRRVSNNAKHADVRAELMSVLYRTGVVGIKTGPQSAVRWADNESYSVSTSEITDECQIAIHPGLWRALGITP